jgi:serine/threonine protein kinase
VTSDPTRVARFQQEDRSASALNHPNVCTIYALGETDDDQYYIAMEYVEGETLRRRLTTSPLAIDGVGPVRSGAVSQLHVPRRGAG